MRLTFSIDYHTRWGESLYAIVANELEVPLHTTDGKLWQGHCDYRPLDPHAPVAYRYAVYRENKCIRKEFGAIAHVFFPDNIYEHHYILSDCWRDLPAKSYRYSSAFNGTDLQQSPVTPPEHRHHAAGITLRALCPGLQSRHCRLALTGSGSALGNWGQEALPLPMQEVLPNVWHLTLETDQLASAIEYKFVAVDVQTGHIAEWECGDNRSLSICHLNDDETWLPQEAEVNFEAPAIRVAGTAIPVFSLRSEGSFGVGDFGDLKTFIGWAADTHQKAVQILPINDTTMTGTWSDSYPYNSISIYAFHPMYADLRQLPPLADAAEARRFEEQRRRLNALPQLEYEEVNRWKRAYLKAIYRQEKHNLTATADYQAFVQQNRQWLEPYAAFRYLCHRFGTPDFRQWEDFSTYNDTRIAQLRETDADAADEMAYHCFVQYVLHVQLLAACTYGRQRGVIVKGDIPIGISRTSVEAWKEPYYFNMNGQAGAPPDAFATNGQNWGMPTYNWRAMEGDGYLWWRQRFHKMAHYFTAYRIDHILGFFRIWEIPIDAVHGLLGHFSPALPMSVEEIESYGLTFRKELMTQPFIDGPMLDGIFGNDSRLVRETFVTPQPDGRYAMRPEFDTQRKVEAYFAGRTDENSLRLKEGLFALISDVLFIPDNENPDLYHPRIAVQNDYVFRQLDKDEQDAFCRLYNYFYYERHNDFWYREAMKKLPTLTQSTSMLVCGEDLGMVPACVPWVMEQLQILSLEIQRMPKSPQDTFGHVERYPYLSVCSIGTHDMSTLRGWWEEDMDVTTRFYHDELGYEGEVPVPIPGWLCEDIVRRHLHSPSMLCILTWQDWMSMDETLRNPDIEAERINIPAHPRHYWRWRMHLTLEELARQTKLNDNIRNLIDESNRF